MATTVGSHSVSAFATPVNGGPLDANVVRGNDNTIRTAYVAHDSDTGIHVQSSSLASRPSAGTAGRKWITVDTGSYKLWYDDGTTWHEVGTATIDVFVIADENLVKGDVVKVTGYNNGTGAPRVAKVSSASDVAFGIMNQTVANGATGYLTNTGIIADVATNAFAIGDILYPNTSGGFTATKPTSGNYQPCAYVLRSNANNGVLYVEFSAPRIVERSDNTASTVVLRDASGNFSAGTITAGALTSTGLVTFASLKGTGATTVTNILDEDNMASDSATALATQQSIKAYVDTKVATVDTLAEVLANGNTTGANNIIVSTGQRIQTPAITAGDGTASATIANSTGVMTIASSVLTTTDINGGTIDGTTIGGSSAAAGTFTTVAGTTGNITTVNATTVDTTNIEVTNVKAKDGTASIAIADSTGIATISAAPVLSALTASQAVFTDASKGLVSNAITGTGNVVMSASPTLTGTIGAANMTLSGTLGVTSTATFSTPLADSNLATIATAGKVSNSATTATSSNTASAIVARDASGNFTAGTITANLTGNISGTAPAGTLTGTTLASNVVSSSLTSVGTLTSLTVSGDLTVDTSTLKVDSANNRVGIGTASPSVLSHISNSANAAYVTQIIENSNSGGYVQQIFKVGSSEANIAYVPGTSFAIGPSGSDTTTPLIFRTNNATTQLTLTTSGNLGLGVTPSTTNATKMLQLGYAGTGVQVFSQVASVYSQNAYYNSGWKYGGTGQAMMYVMDSGVHSWYTAASGTAGNAIAFTTAMTLDASGNLGVGTDSPSSYARVAINAANQVTDSYGLLYVGTTDSQAANKGGQITMGGVRTGTTQSAFGAIAGRKESSTDAELKGYLQFSTFNSTLAERARITAGGYFKASDSGTYALSTGTLHEFCQSASAVGLAVLATNATYGSTVFEVDANRNTTNNSFYYIDCYNNGASAYKFRVADSGNVTNTNGSYGTIPSERRFKQDIIDAPSQWDDIKNIRLRKFRLKSDVEQHGDDAIVQLGVIVDELEQVSPGLVDEHPVYESREVTDEDGNVTTEKVLVDTVKGWKTSIVHLKALGALQEAMARIEALEARLEALEA